MFLLLLCLGRGGDGGVGDVDFVVVDVVVVGGAVVARNGQALRQ